MHFYRIISFGTIFIFLIFFSVSAFSQQAQGSVSIESSAGIDKMVAQKKQYNKGVKNIKGFKIQLFYGNEKKAYEIKDEFTDLFPEIPTKIIFSSPEWKVHVGNYNTRLEADHALVEIKKEFNGAIILATDIEFEK